VRHPLAQPLRALDDPADLTATAAAAAASGPAPMAVRRAPARHRRSRLFCLEYEI
jgi:hypothetical protein